MRIRLRLSKDVTVRSLLALLALSIALAPTRVVLADPGAAGAEDARPSVSALHLSGSAYVALGACGDLRLEAIGGPTSSDRRGSINAGTLTIFAGAGCQGAPVNTFILRAGTAHLDFSFSPESGGHSAIMAALDGGPTATFPVDVFAPASASADPASALVVFNRNVPDSQQIAEHYAEARGLDTSQLCPVRLPPGYFASPDELLGARRTIVEDCICNLLDPEIRPEPCAVGNLAAIAAVSPISHMTLIRGVPVRLTGTGWSGDGESPSLGYYLSYLVYNDDTIFGIDTKRGVAPDYPPSPAVSHHPPALSPSTVPWLAYGYLEAADTERTIALIDRTMSAEARGFSGNVVGEKNMSDPLSNYLVKLTSSFAPACSDYLHHLPFIFGDPASSWPWRDCAFGTTGTDPIVVAPGNYPGETDTSIPYPVAISTFLGTDPWPNTQVGFDGFDVMKRWHRNEESCTELCADLPTPIQVEQCREESIDYFRELNSSCVGVRDGFIGYQTRSWPVQYMGFFPSGWSTVDSGEWEKTVPVVVETGGFRNERFHDDRFARFGDSSFGQSASCELESGAEVACPQRVPIALSKRFVLDPPLPLDGLGNTRTFHFRVRFRNPATPGAHLHTWGVFRGNVAPSEQWDGRWHLLGDAHSNWTTWEGDLVASAENLLNSTSITEVSIVFLSDVYNAPRGYMDLDGIELVDVSSGLELMDVDTGSFNRNEQQTNRGGDLAANIIDRLGGVGAFGSSSHFFTGGWAFSRMDRAAPMLFSGRTLGESLLPAGRHQSGLIFADPMYRPASVSLHAVDGKRSIFIDPRVVPPGYPPVVAHAFWGGDNLSTLRWSLASCENFDVAACSTDPAGTSGWRVLARGVGAVDGAVLNWASLEPPGVEPRVFTLRLQVLDPNDPGRSWSSYVTVEVSDGTKPKSLPEGDEEIEPPAPMDEDRSIPIRTR